MGHTHGSAHEPHSHGHAGGILNMLAEALHLPGYGHSHEHLDNNAVLDNQLGIRTVWLALGILGITALIQIGIVGLSGSVALLGDTAHNIGDTLNSIPLLAAFYLARRAATRRYTYGFGRAEDIAGIFILLSIVVSAGVVLWESVQKLIQPQPMQNIPWVALAAVVGFVGNEGVALLQIRVGRKIGSEAMITDGLHARTDGLTSLAVLVAAGGAALGLPIIDPIIGLVIGVVIMFIAKDATARIWYRLMDAVDPAIVHQMEHFAGEVAGVEQVVSLRAHWVGHDLYGVMTIVVDENRSVMESHQIVEGVRAGMKRAIPHLREVSIQVHPRGDKPDLLANMLPPRYLIKTPNAAPMGAAALKYDAAGQADWNAIWTDFCDLALAGGPPHRGTLLEPINPAHALANPEAYEMVLVELERGIQMVTGLKVIRSTTPGWIGMECTDEAMALWLLRAIVVENVSVRREDKVLYFPASPDFRLEREIKNVITVIAKTNHYWQEHAQSLQSH